MGEGGRRKRFENAPTEPGVKMLPGMMPILQPPLPSGEGAMIPGQLGPTRRDLLWRRRAWATCCERARRESVVPEESIRLPEERERTGGPRTRTSSDWGMPSVMQTMRGISASMASMMASAANGGGT